LYGSKWHLPKLNDNDLFKVEKRRKWSPNLPSQRLMLKALHMLYYNYIYIYKNFRILELLIDSYNIGIVQKYVYYFKIDIYYKCSLS
jgi:hypothetical protein